MTNAQRAARARTAFDAVTHDDNDPITNLTDLIADMLHLADEIHRGAGGVPDVIGEWAAEHAMFHYVDEVAEENADAHAMAEAA